MNSRNSQRKKDTQMQIVFFALTSILIIIFLTPFYFLVTDPQAPWLFYQSSIAENSRVSSNNKYITMDWNFVFLVHNTDKEHAFSYQSINADMLDEDGNLIVAADQHQPLMQGKNTKTEIVFKFRNASFPILEGSKSGSAKVAISMRWKLHINGGSMPKSRYTGLKVNCGGSVEYSIDNSQHVDVSFVDEDDDQRCDAHLNRLG